jgi:hypothetical protein
MAAKDSNKSTTTISSARDIMKRENARVRKRKKRQRKRNGGQSVHAPDCKSVSSRSVKGTFTD